jgi:hypothetical protein
LIPISPGAEVVIRFTIQQKTANRLFKISVLFFLPVCGLVFLIGGLATLEKGGTVSVVMGAIILALTAYVVTINRAQLFPRPVTAQEAEQVLRADSQLASKSPGRFYAEGVTAAGRYLTIVGDKQGSGDYVISAAEDMDYQAKRAYRKQAKK